MNRARRRRACRRDRRRAEQPSVELRAREWQWNPPSTLSMRPREPRPQSASWPADPSKWIRLVHCGRRTKTKTAATHVQGMGNATLARLERQAGLQLRQRQAGQVAHELLKPEGPESRFWLCSRALGRRPLRTPSSAATRRARGSRRRADAWWRRRTSRSRSEELRDSDPAFACTRPQCTATR